MKTAKNPLILRLHKALRASSMQKSRHNVLPLFDALEPRLLMSSTPVGTDDNYDATEDTPLIVDTIAEGVLDNDTDAEGDPFVAVLETPPTNGNVALNSDGTFTYTPDPDFNGNDSFTYRPTAEVLAPDTLTVDQTQSNVNMAATLTTDLGSDDDSDSSSITGTIDIDTSQGANTAQITDLDLVLADAVSLNFSYLFGAATFSVNADPGALSLQMVTPGAPGVLTGNTFSQTGNTVRVAGIATLNAGGLVEDGPVDIDTEGQLDIENATIVENNGQWELIIPIQFSGTFDVDGQATVEVQLNGQVRATGGSIVVGDPGNVTTVNIDVEGTADVPTAEDDNYSTDEDTPLVVDAALGVLANDYNPDNDPVEITVLTGPTNGALSMNPDGSFTYEPALNFNGSDSFTYSLTHLGIAGNVSSDASWKYLDDGIDQGTTWRNAGFDDSSWAEGNAQLGYGENDNQTTISFLDTDPVTAGDQKNATSYFRNTFDVTDVNQISSNGLPMRLLRDDAAAVYVNGVEVFRDDTLTANAPFDEYASATINENDAWVTIFVDAGLLNNGSNTVAVEVHQQSATSSDVSFNLVIGESVATVDIEIDAVNDLPIVEDETYDIDKDTVLTGENVLDNDSDPEGGEITAKLLDGPNNGTLVLDSNGDFIYTPDAGFTGTDTFTYRVIDEDAPRSQFAILPFGSTWTYLDDGSDQGTAWIAPEFADGGWDIGTGNFGYGNGNDTIVDFGGDDQNKHITTYFRTILDGENLPDLEKVFFDIILDDGAAVYLNGVELIRQNLDAGAAFDTTANGAVGGTDESTPTRYEVDPSLILDDVNYLAVEVHQAAPTSSDLSFDLQVIGQTIEETQTETAIDFGSDWKYLDNGSNQGTNWRNLAFNDASWSVGFGELGYGDGDEDTEVSFGGDGQNKHITTYFRKSFELSDVDDILNATISLIRDDGAAVYVNGTEVHRSNLDGGAGFDTPANTNASGDGKPAIEFEVDPSLFIDGNNVIAVEIHQDSGTSSDISFDLKMDFVKPVEIATGTATINVISPLGNPGDFNNDLMIDDADIDLLATAIRENNQDPIYDIDGNPGVDINDYNELITGEDFLNTLPGDATLDGIVNLEDLAKLATFFGQPGGWASGDFTGDAIVNLEDLARLATNFGMSTGGGKVDLSGGEAASGALLVNTASEATDDSNSSWDHIDSILDEDDDQNIV